MRCGERETEKQKEGEREREREREREGEREGERERGMSYIVIAGRVYRAIIVWRTKWWCLRLLDKKGMV